MEHALRDELLALFKGKLTRPTALYLETCARCGVCTEACHAYAPMPLPKYAPAHREEVVRRIYKQYFKWHGRIWPAAGECKTLDETALDELKEAACSCTG
ncbi:MAG: hypothetical protein JRI76_01200 [Deltaproteobacteria bacterium]|nr:hypothetical protein [Deltaproteobacteria bacterium]